MDRYFEMILSEFKNTCKEYGCKYQRTNFGVYKSMNDLFWVVRIFPAAPGPDHTAVMNVKVFVKSRLFDDFYFNVMDPGKTMKVTDRIRLLGYGLFTVKEFEVSFPFESDDTFTESDAHKVVISVYNNAFHIIDEFAADIAGTAEGLEEFLIMNAECFPYEAGCAYMCRGDYHNALKAFQNVDVEPFNQDIYRQIFGFAVQRRPCDVMPDYCRHMIDGIPWSSADLY